MRGGERGEIRILTRISLPSPSLSFFPPSHLAGDQSPLDGEEEAPCSKRGRKRKPWRRRCDLLRATERPIRGSERAASRPMDDERGQERRRITGSQDALLGLTSLPVFHCPTYPPFHFLQRLAGQLIFLLAFSSFPPPSPPPPSARFAEHPQRGGRKEGSLDGQRYLKKRARPKKGGRGGHFHFLPILPAFLLPHPPCLLGASLNTAQPSPAKPTYPDRQPQPVRSRRSGMDVEGGEEEKSSASPLLLLATTTSFSPL